MCIRDSSNEGDICYTCSYGRKDHNSSLLKANCDSSEMYRCGNCHKSFRDLKTKSHHELLCSSLNSYQSGICNKMLINNKDVASSMSVRSEVKKHCKICNKVLRKSNLSRHYLTHSGVKNYQCEICSKIFSRKSSLSTHMMKIHNSQWSIELSV